MKRPLGQFMKLSWGERGCLLEAFIALLVARCLTVILSAGKIVELLKTNGKSNQALTDESIRQVQCVKDAIHRIAPYMPVRAVCLQKAIAGRIMLQRRDIASQFTFGVHTEDGQVKAHAWLKSGDYWVTGEESANINTELLTLGRE